MFNELIAYHHAGYDRSFMIRRLSHLSIWVRDQEEALKWYVEKLDFQKRMDDAATILGLRWLTVAPKDQKELEIVLALPQWAETEAAVKDHQRLIGKSSGFVLVTDDCRTDYEKLKSRGVEFDGPPQEMPGGISANFKDLYGKWFNLLQPRTS